MNIPNLSALRRQAVGTTTGTTDGKTVSLAFATVATATEANTGAVPTNPSSPSVPSSTDTETNTHPYAVNVSITGGTVTVVKVNGTATGLTSGNFVVPSGGTIAITYSEVPDWVWTNAGGSGGFVEVLVGTTVVKVPYLPA